MVNKIAQMLIDCGAIEFGDFTLASGIKSSYYIDIKSALTNPAVLEKIAKAMADKNDFDVVAGVALGAVPLAVATSLASKKPYAIIRKTEKGHGKSGALIGDVRGKRVLLVEDVTTSGGSVAYGIECLRDAGAIVGDVYTVVDREEGASETLGKLGIKLSALIRASEILNR
jgi:orotate phosphoribosyltransferase